MQARHSKKGLGRPSGTDGSDYNYRMTVDDRYLKVAQRKRQLSRILAFQASCQVLALPWEALATLRGGELNITAVFSTIIGFVAFLCGEIGRKQSNSKLLKFYLFTSLIATALSVEHAKPAHVSTKISLVKLGRCFASEGTTNSSCEQFIGDFKQNQDTDSILELFDAFETWRVLGGLLLQIIAMLTVSSLLKNMSPKRAS